MKDCLPFDPFRTSSTSLSVPVAPCYSVHSSYEQPQIILKDGYSAKTITINCYHQSSQDVVGAP